MSVVGGLISFGRIPLASVADARLPADPSPGPSVDGVVDALSVPANLAFEPLVGGLIKTGDMAFRKS